MLLTHHTLIRIRTKINVDGIRWGSYVPNYPLLSSVFSGCMKVEWSMVTTFHVLEGNWNVVVWLLL